MGPFGWLLILLSIAVLSVTFERIRFWLLWWQSRRTRRHQWMELLSHGGTHPHQWIHDRDQEMRFAQSFLEAATVIAPLIGLTGTVFGLNGLLSAMGPQLVPRPETSFSRFGEVLLSTGMGLLVCLLATVTLHLNHALRQWQQAQWRRDLTCHGFPRPSP